MLKGVTQTLPAPVHFQKGFDLQHGTNARVARAAMPSAEQPAIDFLPLGLTGQNSIAETTLRVAAQMAQQPQL